MLIQQSDHEIVAIITEKIGVAPISVKYDANDRLINLELSELALSQLPTELWQLTSLQELWLRNNQLSQLPAELWQLTNLQELNLSANRMIQLPTEIGQLTSLQTLIVSDIPS
jgi:Leucine-rich repeat (LRR) protein